MLIGDGCRMLWSCCFDGFCRRWPQMWMTESPFSRQWPTPTHPPKVQFSTLTPHIELIPWQQQMAFPPQSHHNHKLRRLWEACRGHPSLFSRSSSPRPERLKNNCKYYTSKIVSIVQRSQMLGKQVRWRFFYNIKQAVNGKQNIKEYSRKNNSTTKCI